MCRRQKTAGDNKKEDMASPKVSKDSVFIPAAVDTHECWDVATFDILGGYLHTETYEDVIIFLEGALAYLMVKVTPKI